VERRWRSRIDVWSTSEHDPKITSGLGADLVHKQKERDDRKETAENGGEEEEGGK